MEDVTVVQRIRSRVQLPADSLAHMSACLRRVVTGTSPWFRLCFEELGHDGSGSVAGSLGVRWTSGCVCVCVCRFTCSGSPGHVRFVFTPLRAL